jgi:hypothetical protein
LENQGQRALLVKRAVAGKQAIPVGPLTAANICEALPQLNSWGFRCVQGDVSATKHEELRAELLACASSGSTLGNACVKPDALKQLLRWLSGFEHSERWSSYSYSLKHIFERETGVYVTDGLFILGALMAGFTARFWNNSPSAKFKMHRPGVR